MNWEGVKYYDNLIDHVLELGIDPYVTLYHWDMPQALDNSIGGWLSPDIMYVFSVDFCLLQCLICGFFEFNFRISFHFYSFV